LEQSGGIRWPEPRDMRLPGGSRGSRYRVKAAAVTGLGGFRVLVFPPDGPDTRLILLFDDATGEPRAIVDESWTYPHRSVASVVLLARHLAIPDVTKVALIGAGRLAEAALPYLHRLFPEAIMSVASRREATRVRLAQLARREFGIAATAGSPEESVRGAQVIVGCTSAKTAVLDDSWVESGAVVASMETAECGPAFYFGADLRIADSPEQLEDELRNCYGPEAPGRLDATMAEVIVGSHSGRTDMGQRILVLSQGLASQDVLLAARAVRAARERGIGSPLPIPPSPRPVP
jgi:ornithine cyclodeaminase/alanine dehydrogenase-like protein (mu-crystallin family)